jgi:hypothetical protein
MQPATVHTRQWRRPARKLTEPQVARIRALPWEPCTRLARELGVSPSLVSQIRNGYRYKRALPQQTYYARVTDGSERYALGSFLTPEAAQNAIDNFPRTNRWPRGSIERTKQGRYRARVALNTYATRWAAERAIEKAMTALRPLSLK